MAQGKTDPRKFDSAEEDATFWETYDTAPQWDSMEEVAIEVRAKRRPCRMVSLRISEEDLGAIETMAEQKGIPYRTLMRLRLVEGRRRRGAEAGAVRRPHRPSAAVARRGLTGSVVN